MAFRNLLKKFGAWTTVMKWHEPWMYRVRLKGDWIARFALAFAVGSLATTGLLMLFAINIKPPNPLFAFTGMAIFGGLVFMFLVNGRGTAGGRVRLCEEGIVRRRMYAGVSSQWVEDWNWPYAQIPQCAVIPSLSLDKSFHLLLLTDGSNVDLIGIPERVDLEQVAQLLESKGVIVRRDVGVPSEYSRPMGLPMPLLAGVIGFFVLLGGFGFYFYKTAGRDGNELAAGNRKGARANALRRGAEADVARPLPPQAENVIDPAPLVPPLPVQPMFPASDIPNLPLRPNIDPPAADVPTPNPVPQPPTTPNPDLSTPTPTPTPTKTPTSTTTPSPTPTPSPVTSQSRSANKTDLIGGGGGAEFEVIPPSRDPIVGFRYRLGRWGGKSAVAQLDPLIQRNPPGAADNLVVAREGFVVGGIQVDAEDLVRAVRVIFVKRADDGTLDKNDFYFSDWIGATTGGTAKTLGKGTIPVIGVYGRRGLVIDAIGLVLAE